MDKLAQHINAAPEKRMKAWADDFGISRPYLYGLLDGTRSPSVEVAQRIENATGGTVPVRAWPKLAAIAEAARGAA